jgi:hypothetical protein
MHCVSTAQSIRGAFAKTQIFNLSCPDNNTLLSIVPRMLTIHVHVLYELCHFANGQFDRDRRIGSVKHTSDAIDLSFSRYEPVKIVQVDVIYTESAERLVKRLLYELWIRSDNSCVLFVML